MRNAFAAIVPARPCPILGRPVHPRGCPHRLRSGTSPHTLRIPPRGGHPVIQGFPWPARNYPHLWIECPSFGHSRDLNPPDSCAAQRTLRLMLTPRSVERRRCPFRHKARSPRIRTTPFRARPSDLRHCLLVMGASRILARSPQAAPPDIRFLFVGPRFRSALPSHGRSPFRSCDSLGSL